jgi:hypothetical protein
MEQSSRYSDQLRAGKPKGRSKECSLIHVVRTGSGAQPVSQPMLREHSLPRDKVVGREADHSPPTSAEVKKAWVHIFTPQ